MTSVSSATLALQILRQPSAAPESAQKTSAASDVAAVASGTFRQTGATTSAQTANALFSVNSPNLNKTKIDLFKKVGDALGVKESDYDSPEAYGAALKKVVAQIKLDPDAQQTLSGIEKDLGLDKLGMSLDTVIKAIIDPKGGDGRKLDAALGKQINTGHAVDEAPSFGITSDDIGLYARSRSDIGL